MGTVRRLAGTLALTLAFAPASASGQVPSVPGGDAPRFDSKGRPIAPEPPMPDEVTFPERTNDVQPEYTPEAVAAGVQGAVRLKVTIDAAGSVVGASVVEGLGYGLDESALAAAKKLTFIPAKRNGKPFKATITYQFDFTLKEKPVEPVRTDGALEGTLLAANDEAPIASATVRVAATGEGASASASEVTTDAQGKFALPKLPVGDYLVTVNVDGFEPFVVTEAIVANEQNVAVYRMKRPAIGPTPKAAPGVIEIDVTGERPPREVTRRTIEKRELERIPGTNGDALRAIQNLPGVARPPGLAGLLLVRGSAPQDTQTFIDGTFVPLIYHFGGLSSVVPTELINKIDFYPGNFSVKYGRATGGIVDAGLRAPRNDGFHGLVQLDLIDARALIEGPIPGTDGKWSYAVAARRSYLDSWLGPVLEQAGAGVTQAPVYYDYQVILDGKPKPGHHLRSSYYGSDDSLELLLREPAANEPALSGNFGLNTQFQRVAFQYDVDLGGGARFDSSFSFGRDFLQFNAGELFFKIKSHTLYGRAEYTTKIAKNATVHVGLDMLTGRYEVAVRLPPPPIPGQPPNQPFSTRTAQTFADRGTSYRPAGYVEVELTPTPRLRLVPGFRLDYEKIIKRYDFSPRMNARYAIRQEFPKTTAKLGVGVFYQPPQPQQSLPPIGTANLLSNRAIHYGLGVEQDVTRQVELSVEGFVKQLDDLVVARPSPTGGRVDYSNTQLGYVVGGELLLKYKADDRFFGWLAYTLSRSARQDGPGLPEYLVNFDQTHILTALGSYRLGGGWELGARFRLISGSLVQPNVCDATSITCDPARVGGLFHGATGAYTPIPFGSRASERLPMFHSLDIRVDKAWQFQAWKLSAYLDVQNSYNNQNPEAITYNFNFTQRQFVSGLPILPSIGMRGDW
ncbi:MAG: TonB-dependent receptor [Deltaproteobacteria bacterium]|nr:TonB-dependent receptor [Deltaproteobacteria bacterium]